MSGELQRIIGESGLEATKARVMLAKFQDYFDLAAEWEAKAKTIKVTAAEQVEDMAQARKGRLFLREKRISVERTRKELKEQALREGKAIDGIANVLKSLIVPIEEYLEQQERFVEIQAEREAELDRIMQQEREEAERVEREKAEAAEREKIRAENERLRREAVERERAEQERIEAEERKRRKLEQEALTAKLDAEKKVREAQEKAEAEKREAQRKVEEAERKARQERAELERQKQKAAAEAEAREAENKRLQEQLEKAMVSCPKCGHRFAKEEPCGA